MWQLDVALLRAAALPGGMHSGNGRVLLPLLQVAASLPRTSRKKRAFPLMSGGAASAGVCLAPAVHAPPPLSMRDLTLDDQPKFSRLGIALQTRCREPLVWFLRSTWMFMRFPVFNSVFPLCFSKLLAKVESLDLQECSRGACQTNHPSIALFEVFAGLPVMPLKWDEAGIERQQAESLLAQRQKIDEPKTQRYRWSAEGRLIGEVPIEQLAAGVTLQKNLLKKLRELFQAIDTDGNGELSRAEATAYWGSNFARVNASSMFDQLDADGNDSITWDEYITFWKAVVGVGHPQPEIVEEIDNILSGHSWVSFSTSPSVAASFGNALSRVAVPGYSEAMRRFWESNSARPGAASPTASPAAGGGNPFEFGARRERSAGARRWDA